MRKHLAVLVLLASCSSKSPANDDGGVISCEAPRVACSGSCADLKLDDTHCGACGAACPEDQRCAGGQCYAAACGTLLCAGTQVCVSNLCVDRACFGVVCPANESCAGGTCHANDCGAVACGTGEVCVSNACVEAVCVGVICPAGLACTQGRCEADTCGDGLKSGTESDTDCGGTLCRPCDTQRACVVPLDCASRVCTAGKCQAPTCTDSVRNGQEGDADCGGNCAPCADGRICVTGTQCSSGVCAAGNCAAASCADGAHNGAESDKDCGGTCPGCADGLSCAAGSDCTSLHCLGGRCAPASCQNAMKEPNESDVDCGGVCGACDIGRVCGVGADCTSKVCSVTNRCLAPSCADSTVNGVETDIDCGGGCPACAVGRQCKVTGDCVSRSCQNGRCAAPTCTDGLVNGGESDVDCGGTGSCMRCATGKNCVTAADCMSGAACAGTCGPVPLLGAPVSLAVGNAPRTIASGDLDGDGLADLAIANRTSGDITVWFSEPDGGFTAGPSPQVQSANGLFGPMAVAIGDVNLDQRPDLVIARTENLACATCAGCRISILSNAGNRAFASSQEFPTTANGTGCGNGISLARLNGDTTLDLVTTDGPDTYDPNSSTGEVYAESSSGWVVLGGQMTPPATATAVPALGLFVTTGDIDRDGAMDIVSHHVGSGLLKVYLGNPNGSGTFMSPPRTIGVSAGPGDVAVALLNADAEPDLVVCSRTADRVGVALATGMANFLAPASYTVSLPDGVAVADLDGDGQKDLVVGSTGIAVLRGNGDGTFRAPELFGTAALGDSGQVVVADFNADGKPDVATLAGGRAWVLFNVRP